MKRFILPLAAATLALPLLQSCKPTEKNYKAAYDLAQKREHDDLDDELFRKMKREGLPKPAVFGADTLWVSPKEPLLVYWNPAVSEKAGEMRLGAPRAYSVVVGIYRNPANALAHAGQFRADSAAGWTPAVLHNPAEDTFYVSVASSDTLSSLVSPQKTFLSRGLRTVGTDRPLIRSRR